MNVVAALDIEIIQDPKAIQFIPDKKPSERTDPWEKLKFDSNFNMVCCWATWDGEQAYSGLLNIDGTEAEILDSLWWDTLHRYEQVITYNGLTFDIPFIIKRSWYNNIQPSKRLNLKRYQTPDRTTNHIDLRAILSNWDNNARGSLDLYANLKLGAGKTGIDGSMVQAMWDEGKYEEIRQYCIGDCKLTFELYQSMKGFYL